MKPLYAIVDAPVSEYVKLLAQKKIITIVYGSKYAVVGRYGTNRKTLSKILKTL